MNVELHDPLYSHVATLYEYGEVRLPPFPTAENPDPAGRKLNPMDQALDYLTTPVEPASPRFFDFGTDAGEWLLGIADKLFLDYGDKYNCDNSGRLLPPDTDCEIEWTNYQLALSAQQVFKALGEATMQPPQNLRVSQTAYSQAA